MYNLDPNLAKKADVIGAYINETGKYTGTFIRAEKLVSASKGTDGIGFTFKDEAGRECRFDVWTRKGDGSPLSGLNQINAMMACLQLRGMQPVMMHVKKWDNDQGMETSQEVACFADIMGKPIGVLLRMEEYEKMKDQRKTGEHGWRVGLFAVFQAGTELMASEILGRKTKPEQLEKVVGMLSDKALKKTAQRPANAASDAPAGIPFDDDADIPF